MPNGLFGTPIEELRGQRRGEVEQLAAQQSPITGEATRTAGTVEQLLGGLFGLEADPAMQRAQQLAEARAEALAAAGTGEDESAFLESAATALEQRGFADEAMQARQQAREIAAQREEVAAKRTRAETEAEKLRRLKEEPSPAQEIEQRLEAARSMAERLRQLPAFKKPEAQALLDLGLTVSQDESQFENWLKIVQDYKPKMSPEEKLKFEREKARVIAQERAKYRRAPKPRMSLTEFEERERIKAKYKTKTGKQKPAPVEAYTEFDPSTGKDERFVIYEKPDGTLTKPQKTGPASFEKMRREIAEEKAASAAAPSAVAEPSLPTPQTEAEFNALPSGTQYIDPDDGQTYRKP